MGVLGADTEGLTSVGSFFRTAGSAANESGASVVNTCNTSVEAILAEMERAERTCMDAIQAMADSNRVAASALAGVEYNGQNAVVARESSNELQQRCLQAQTDMQGAFVDARTSVTALGESVTTIATDYNNYAVQVAESEDVMAQNMDTQRANLEAAMNGFAGWSDIVVPTEEQFEEAGARFDAAAEGADELLRPTRQANSRRPLHGGGLTRDVNGFVNDAGKELKGLATKLRDLARQCRERAQECREAKAARDAYLAAEAEYQRDAAEHALGVAAAAADPTALDPGPKPTAPTPPPSPPPYVTI